MAVRFFDVNRAFLNTPVRRKVFLKPPPKYLAEMEDSVWELDKVMCGLEEAMVELDDYFEEVVAGHFPETSGQSEALNFENLVCKPVVFYHRAWDVVISKHVDDGLVCGPPDKV